MCRVIFPTFISTSRGTDAALLLKLPSLEVTAGCMRFKRAGVHTNVHAGPVGWLILLPAAQGGESKTSRQLKNFIIWLQPVCLFFPFFFPTPIDQRLCSHAGGRGGKGGEHEGGSTYSLFSIPPHVSAVIAFRCGTTRAG